ncbi:hypothetical protein GDO86_013713, partial [Hymenochirus boettgeri]
CSKPPQIESAVHKPDKPTYDPGDVAVYSCIPGFTWQSGSHKVVCERTGRWSYTGFHCERRRCVFFDTLENGEIFAKDNRFQSVVYFSCKEGTGTWSDEKPTRQPVTCLPPPVPEFGYLTYYKPKDGNYSWYTDVVKFQCQTKYAMFGNETATCMANGNWSQTPECREIKCNRPTEIENGFMSFALDRKYDYKETVTYGCNPYYVMQGSRTIFCDKTGDWTAKPECKASCKVNVKKAHVLYNGNRVDVNEIPNQLILHGESLTYFCADANGKCAHLADSQCLDGQFVVPSCYK